MRVGLGIVVGLALVTACHARTADAPRARPATVAARVAATATATAPPSKAPSDTAATADAPARPCGRGSREQSAAEAAIASLDARIKALPADGDPSPIAHDVTALFATPCFTLAAGELDTLAFDSALSLETWWKAGGEAWASHYLRLADAPGTPNAPVWSWVPPTPRRSLTSENAKRSPLAPLLCPSRDDACGRETLGWLARARLALESHAKGRAQEAPANPRAFCTQQALAAAEPDRYGAWRGCLLGVAPHVDALPLGRFRAPTDGWLVLRGRRGHYSFCDEVRAYDLATGAAFVAGTCSGLALRNDGSVDAAATDRKRKPREEIGSVPLDNLREAALVTLLSPLAQNGIVVEGYGLALPPEVKPQGDTGFGGLSLSASGSSAQTTLAWTWVRSGRAVASGTLTWPDDMNDGARDHAVKLIQVAEAAFTPLANGACARVVPPSPLPVGREDVEVSRLDGAVDPKVNAESSHALDGLRRRACTP